jgi:myosin heavy subunit
MSQKGSKKGPSPGPSVDSLESLLASKDQSEALQKKIDELTNETKELRSKHDETIAQMHALDAQLIDLNAEHEALKASSEKDCELKESLTAQLNGLNEELKDLKKSVSMKDEAMATKDNQLMDKDEIIKNKDEELQSLNNQISDWQSQLADMQAQVSGAQSSQSDKVNELQAQIMALQKENEMAKLAEANSKTKLQELTGNYEKLKIKMRDTGDSVLGATMEAEKLKNAIEQKDAEIAALNEKLGAGGGSGAFMDKEKLAQVLFDAVQKTQRSIRICVPSISLIETLGLLPVIQSFPRQAVVNIAGDIKATDEHIIMDLKKHGVVFTQYDRKDRWVLNRDGEDFLIAVEQPDGTVIGFYSSEPRVITMFNSVIMEPWVKGMKI